MKGFFDTIPNELDESARVDGATPAQIFWGIILPLGAPVLAVDRAALVRLDAERVRHRVRAAPVDRTSTRCRSGCTASSPTSTTRTGARSAPASLIAAMPVVRPLLVPPAGIVGGLTRAPSRDDTRCPLGEPHHDGSRALRPRAPSELGDDGDGAPPRAARVAPSARVSVRYVRDGEPQARSARRSTRRPRRDVVAGDVSRWATRRRPTAGCSRAATSATRWVNGAGLRRRTTSPTPTTSSASFVRRGPDWHVGSVVYQVFPDRFASRGVRPRSRPSWAVPRDWDELPDRSGPDDAARVVRRRLARDRAAPRPRRARSGRTSIYLTPVLPGRQHPSLRRHLVRPVDPLLGGDEALVSLARAAHARGMRVIGDLTIEPHRRRPRVVPGRAGGAGRARARLLLLRRRAARTATRLGRRSRRCRSSTTGRASYASGSSGADVVRRWLGRRSTSTAGASTSRNMAGRYRDVDVDRRASRGDALRGAPGSAGRRARRRARARRPAPTSRATAGTGAMNYTGFRARRGRGCAATSCREDCQLGFFSAPRRGCRGSTGEDVVATMRALPRGRPVALASSIAGLLLDSHDTARFSTVAGSRERHLVGIGLQMTTPGRADGLRGRRARARGRWGEDARRTMPWDRPESWDTELLEAYRALIALRRSSAALARGGIRYAHVGADAIAYLRETRGRAAALPRGPRGAPATSASRSLAALAPLARSRSSAADARIDGGAAVLPGDGPAFHVWRARMNRGGAPMAEVVLKDVDKVYANGFHAVKDLSLEIEDGEFLVLVGPSGCGKTTALRMVAGLEDDHRRRGLDRRPRRQRAVAEGPRHRDGVPELRALPAPDRRRQHRLRAPAAQDAEARDRRAVAVGGAAMLDLTPYLDRKPKQLSGGQRQRVAMGRAIVREPQVFLMDEPLSNLDAKLRVQMRARDRAAPARPRRRRRSTSRTTRSRR